nr:reverse transcriptase domain-containing protein [Tanacetum cinerariifolium]
MFTRLGPGDKNVFTRLGERKIGVHSQLGPEDVPRHKHISRKRSTSMSTETPSQRRKDAKELIRSYVTCSSKRQQEIEEEWNIVDRASHRPYTRSEELYYSENNHDQGGHWKSKKRKSNDEDNLSQPWLYEETYPFTARIRNFEVPKRIRMSVNVKTVWFDKLSPESIDDYETLRKAFLGNYSGQKKYIKDPVEIQHIKQSEGESSKAFMEKFKAESMHVNGASECKNIEIHARCHKPGSNQKAERQHTKISVNIQRYHRPPGSQENPGGPIYRSLNDKIPSGRRNSDNPQQYHNTSGMQNGSRNTKYPSTQITNGHGRNKSSNPPRVSGVNPEHRLNVREGCQSIRKKIRGQAPDRNKAVQEEVVKLVKAEIMREVHYHDWLSNLVMCFLDAYKGYHQIQMAEEDEEKTAFHTNQGVFCYTKMLFGLKNAKETYQRLADKAFKKQIRNLEVYVDDLVIKSHTKHGILRDVEETFHNLRRINMKLNPKICTFYAEEGAFLGYVISMQGIKACPEKTEAAKKAFQNMKTCIAELPMVTTPKPKEELIMYLCAAKEAVSAVLLAKRTRDRPRTSIRGQILADFIAEKPDEEGPSMEVQAEETVPEPWVLFTDGSSCLEESGFGLILTSPEGKEFTYALRFKFDASNNEAEYEALVAGLRIAKQMGVKNLTAKVDSRLVANQINGLYEAKEQSMAHGRVKKNRVRKLRSPHQASPSRNTQKKINKREGNTSNSGRRGVLLDDIVDRIPYGRFAFVKHPQTNGQVERANRNLGEGIKARLGEDNKIWVEEMPHVLWAHHTMIKTSNRYTPFFLTYGTKAVIPVEIGMPSIRCAEMNQAKNDEELLLNLDILEERGEKETVRDARNKSKMESYYNAKVHNISFRPGDFVYCSNEASRVKESRKLGPK